MSEPLHDIDKLFLDNIEAHTEYPPKKVWDNIEAGLDKTSAVVYKKKYEKTKRAALILLILVAGILVYEVASIHRGKNNAGGNAVKKPGNENATVGTNKDETKIPPKQYEKITALPVIDSDQASNKQGTGITVQNDKIDVKAITNQDEKGIVPEKNISARIQEKKDIINSAVTNTEKNKNIPNIQQPDLTVTPDAVVTDIKTGKKELKNTGVIVPVSEDQAGRRLSPVTENNKPQPAVAKQSSEILKPANPSGIDHLVKLPVIALAGNSAKEGLKPSGKATRVNAGKRGFYLSFFVSPNVTWSSLENDNPHSAGSGGNHIEDHDAIRKAEHSNFSYTGGVKLGYTLNKNITLQTGLNYTSVSKSIDPKLIFADRDNNGNVRYRLDCSAGYSFLLPRNGQNPNRGDSSEVNDSRNSLAYAGIPLAIEYKLIAGKISVSATMGGQANILLRGKTTTTFGKGTSNETSASGSTQALKSTYFSAITGITGEFRLNKKLSLTVTPAGQFGLSSINKGASVKTRPNYLGLAAGLKLKL